MLDKANILFKLFESKNFDYVTVYFLLLYWDVSLFVDWITDQFIPFLLIIHILNVYYDYFRCIWKENHRFRYFFWSLPSENVDLMHLFFAIFIFSLFNKFWKLILLSFLPQKKPNQFHFIEIPKILIIKSSNSFILMFKISQPSSFSISRYTKNKI